MLRGKRSGAAVLALLLGSAVPLAAQPDLVTTQLDIPYSVVRGDSMTVTVAVANRGTATTLRSWTGKVYLSLDTAITSTDIEIGAWSVPSGFAAGSTVSKALRVLVPAATQWGSYYVGVMLDVTSQIAETNERNNLRASAVRLGVLPNVDLVINGIGAPQAISPGTPFNVSINYGNAGKEAWTPAVPVELFLSVDNLRSSEDTRLGSTSVPFGSASSTYLTVTVAQDITPQGPYYLIAVADPAGLTPETDEANNLKASVAVPVGFSNLTFGSVSIASTSPGLTGTSQVYSGDILTLNLEVRNTGPYAAPAGWVASFRTDANRTISTDTVSVDLGTTVLYGSLAAGASSSKSLNLRPQRAWPFSQSQYLVITLDSANVAKETNEGNNVLRVPYTLLPKPDLVPYSATVSRALQAGNTGDISVTVQNAGGGAVNGAWSGTVMLYPSGGGAPVVGGTFSGDPALGASLTQTVTVPVLMKLGSGGSYSLRVVTDTAKLLSEAYPGGELNNWLSAGTVTVLPEIVVDWNASYPQPGTTVATLTPVFAWAKYTGATAYQFALDAGGVTTPIPPTIGSASMVWAVVPSTAPLTTGKNYKAIVRALDVNGQLLKTLEYPFRTP